MTEPRPPQDVDALARRLPRREPGADRSAAMRHAVLDAAQQPKLSAPLGSLSLRGRTIGAAAALAAAACVWLVLAGVKRPASESKLPTTAVASSATSSAPSAPTTSTTAAAPATASLATATPPPAAPATVIAQNPTAVPVIAATPAAPTAPATIDRGEPLAEGVTAFTTTRATQLTRGTSTITAPPDAKFDVEVRGDEVKRITVTAGWVVVAGARATTTIVPMRHVWTLEAPVPVPLPAPPPPPPAAPPSRSIAPAAPAAPPAAPAVAAAAPPITPRAAAAAAAGDASPTRAAPTLPPLPGTTAEPRPDATAPPRAAPPRVTSSTTARDPTAAAAPGEPAPADGSPTGDSPAAAAPAPAPRPPPPGAEQDFRDGLRALIAGNARAAIAPLDRACIAPSSSQDDICYWAAVAWLRSGDREHARRAFTGMLSRWPSSTHAGEANVALGWLLLDIGDRSSARTRFAAAADDRMPTVRANAVRGLAAAQ